MMLNKTQGRACAALFVFTLAAALGSPAAQALTLTEQLGQVEASADPVGYGFVVPLQFSETVRFDGGPQAERVISEALTMLGVRYRYGSNNRRAVDCSALVQKIYRVIGLQLPRTTRQQVHLGTSVALEQLQKGDLLFYRWRPRALHVAVYMDDGYILHASPSAGRVIMTRLDQNWRQRLVAARRVL